jgi:uncharacterized protein (TIGR02099 family)
LRRSLRLLLLGGIALYFAFAGVVLALRYVVLPNIDNYRTTLESLLGDAMQRAVSIRQVEAYWVGLHPALTLRGVDIRDQQGRSALGLEQVEAELAWDSLLFMQLRLARLEIVAPDLVLRRDAAGHLFVAGLEMVDQAEDDNSFSDWLLAQHRVIVRDARLQWIDEQRQAPPLVLNRLNAQLDSRFSRHRFGLTAEPPPALAAAIDLRGDFKGRNLDRLENWRGELFARLDYADLAIWRQWIDYPLALPQGQGGLQLWLRFANRQLQSATADVMLADVRLQLRPDLPEMALTRLAGRLAGARTGNGFTLQTKRLALATQDGLEFLPADIALTWQAAAGKRPAQGRLTASTLNLAAVAGIASYLPLESALRERLVQHAPGGSVDYFDFSWQGMPDALVAWTIKTGFDALHLAPVGSIPGLSGIRGRIEGDEKSGRLDLTGQQASLVLPAIFAEPRVALDRFNADVSWLATAKGVEFDLHKASFENQDAAGDASGRWHPSAEQADGPGVIDLTAHVTRGNGDAVWRYIPLVVGEQTRGWLRDAIHDGKARDVSLRLKGDLWHFPYAATADGKANPKGIFRVQGKFRDVRLDYGSPAWPELTGVEGELLFDGARMLITGKQAKLFGIAVSNARAEIKDLRQIPELLEVNGTANGATAEFLRFVEASPVGERIDHFTAPMQAEGKGVLDIKLALPLRQIDQTRIEGRYRFDNNRLIVDADLPPLTEARGQLNFTGEALESKGLRAQLIGTPMTIEVRTGQDGNVQINTDGEMSVAALRRQYPAPWFDHLAGTTKWNGSVRIRKQKAEVAITSTLLGLTSSLPSPLNKTALESLALRFERKSLPETSAKNGGITQKVVTGGNPLFGSADGTAPDLIDLALGKILRLQLVRRHDGAAPTISRGSLSLGGASLPLPERGLQVAGALPSVDVDAWRTAIKANREANPNSNGDATGENGLGKLPPIVFDVRTDQLTLFDKSFSDIRLSGQHQGALSRVELKSPGLSGSFNWDTTGSGKITGKIGELAIPESLAQPEKLNSEVGTLVEQLPALDIAIGKLSFKGRELGAVNLTAENRDRFWNANFKLDTEETKLKGTLQWRPDPAHTETRLDLGLETKSIQKLFGRLGYVDGINRGTAELSGQLSWQGTPVAIDYPSLTGTLNVNAASGQFTKLEPGVGRLLGVLSLQSLPRRITLDFRDVFSDGFAFDRMAGKFDVKQGVMHTGNMQIQGPSAKVLMNGAIDLAKETQDLKVRVQPAVGETIAVGAMIANPAAGAVAWVAQKLLKDPLDQVFAFEYAVTGQWQDPKVDKLGRTFTVPTVPVMSTVPVEEKK